MSSSLIPGTRTRFNFHSQLDLIAMLRWKASFFQIHEIFEIIPPTWTEREPSLNCVAAALFWMFSFARETNSGICSTPTARPWGPTINAKHAVRYPVPAKTVKNGGNYKHRRQRTMIRKSWKAKTKIKLLWYSTLAVPYHIFKATNIHPELGLRKLIGEPWF